MTFAGCEAKCRVEQEARYFAQYTKTHNVLPVTPPTDLKMHLHTNIKTLCTHHMPLKLLRLGSISECLSVVTTPVRFGENMEGVGARGVSFERGDPLARGAISLCSKGTVHWHGASIAITGGGVGL